MTLVEKTEQTCTKLLLQALDRHYERFFDVLCEQPLPVANMEKTQYWQHREKIGRMQLVTLATVVRTCQGMPLGTWSAILMVVVRGPRKPASIQLS